MTGFEPVLEMNLVPMGTLPDASRMEFLRTTVRLIHTAG